MCTNCKVDFPEIEYRIITSKDSDEPAICLCPNCMAAAISNETLNIPKGNFTSEITGAKGAVMVSSGTGDSQHDFYLTPAEALRLLDHRLLPNEFHKLAEIHTSKIFELHDDFYNEVTGLAYQPILLHDYIADLRKYIKTAKLKPAEKRDLTVVIDSMEAELEGESEA